MAGCVTSENRPLHPGVRRGGALLTLSLSVALWAAPASAVQYESEIDVESEQDLYDLQLEGDISESTLETLVELYRTGVDLNTADVDELYQLPGITYAQAKAILAYRKQAGRIDKPEDLVASGAIDSKLLMQLAPFLTLSDADPRDAVPFSGRAQYGLGWSNADSGGPPMYLRASGKGPLNLSAGLLGLMTRRRLGEVTLVNSHGLSVSEFPEYDRMVSGNPSYQAHLPKWYLEWKKPRYGAIVGTYRVGFGERLTLDNTSQVSPHGYYADDVVFTPQELQAACRESKGDLSELPCTEEELNSFVTPDFTWREGFRGVAARAEAPIGDDYKLQATAFGSYESRSVYQYDIFSRRLNDEGERCIDPSSDSDACKAPPVYVLGSDPTADASAHRYATLPDLYNELAGGGNLTMRLSHYGHVGVTGYYAKPTWNLEPMQLDFQDSARMPYGGPFGAVGVNGGLLLGAVNLFAEAAHSFDSMDGSFGGGGWGVLQRTTLSAMAQELELVLRYYDRDFANPYGRGVSAADEYEGLRARNEAGARLKYRGVYEDWVFSGETDFWVLPEDGKLDKSAGTMNLANKVRVQFDGYDLVRPFVSLEYVNKDLQRGGAFRNSDGVLEGACYESGEEEDESGNDLLCSGSMYRASVGFKVVPFRGFYFDLRYQHELLDDSRDPTLLVDDPYYPFDLRQDSMVRATIAYAPVDFVRVRLRSRYLNEDLGSDTRLEDSIWSYLQVSWKATKQINVGLRYDLYAYADRREATLARAHSPEQRARLELEATF